MSATERLKDAVRGQVARVLPAPVVADRAPTTQVAQRLLFEQYRRDTAEDPWLPDYGLRVYSQSDEDGILLYLLAKLGLGDRRCIEVGLASPFGSNTTNLLVNWGFTGLGIEGSDEVARTVRQWFEGQADTKIDPPQIVSSWLSAASIERVLADAGWAGTPVDVMSIDIDGVDYWLWKALESITPRIVVIEIADMWPPDRSVTVPDDARFSEARELDTSYASASLAAMTKLATAKGYRLVGVHRHGFNAFYVHESVGSFPPAVSVEACAYQPMTVRERPLRLPRMESMEWVEV